MAPVPNPSIYNTQMIGGGGNTAKNKTVMAWIKSVPESSVIISSFIAILF